MTKITKDLIPTVETLKIGNKLVQRGFKGTDKGLSNTLPNMMFSITSSKKYGRVKLIEQRQLETYNTIGEESGEFVAVDGQNALPEIIQSWLFIKLPKQLFYNL